jgi:DNA repair protein RadA/Sms
MGFEKIILSRYHKKGSVPSSSKIQVIAAGRVDEVYRQLF